jgi:tetratricopeptide (TPR) repeat protein
MACGRVQAALAPSFAGWKRASHVRSPRKHAANRARLSLFIAFAAGLLLAVPRPALADAIKADVTASVSGGYARLVFTMSDYDPGSVRKEDNVLVIKFADPLDVSVDRLATQAPDYIGAARRDPDGMAVRLALAQEVTVNVVTAGEKVFVDLLPNDWKGPPPGLPQDVVQDLARRARKAEALLERERRIAALGKIPPVRVRLATEPTFSRFIFAIPPQVSVTAARDKGVLTLIFDAPLRFDFGGILAALPPAVGGIKTQEQDTSASVSFTLPGRIDARTFRDENGYAVDIIGTDTRPKPAIALALPTAPPQPPADAAKSAAEQKPETAAPSAAAPASPRAAPAKPAVAPSVGRVNPAPRLQPTPPQSLPSSAVPTMQSAAPVPPAAAKTATEIQSAAPAKPIAAPAAARANPPPPSNPPAPRPAPIAQTAKATPAPAAKAAPDVKSTAPVASTPAPPASKPAVVAKPANPPPQKATAAGAVVVELAREEHAAKLSFDFAKSTAAAVFSRADTLWLVFDSKADIDLSGLKNESGGTILSADLTRAPDADIVRIKLDRPHLLSVDTEGPTWIVQIGDTVTDPTHALDLKRSLLGPHRAAMSIPLKAPHELHRVTDPEAGDQLLVVTAFAPARGVIETQNFVEFRALATEQGVAVEPFADDLAVGLTAHGVVISRPRGLILSSSLKSLLSDNQVRPTMFDPESWGADRKGSFERRQSQLIADAAEAPANKRLQPRLALIRFYLARAMYPEAKGVLDVELADERPAAPDVTALVLRAVAEIMMGRPESALKDLDNPAVGDQHDAPLWRALAYARQGKWAEARASFKRVESAIATLPIQLQRFALKEEMRAAVEIRDFAGAQNDLNDLQTIGIPHDMQPAMSVLMGQLDEGLGRNEEALTAYRAAADSWDLPAAAQGKLRETLLRYSLGKLKRDQVVSALESLTTVWRGDATEIEALQVLARLYTEEGRYRDSFYVMRSAMTAHPNWDMTRKIQEEAAKTFDSLFLAGKGDSLSAIDALSLFYDFRELTPIGSRGDEMIRRLADRLVSVDLLDQAAGLLQYQVDNRLQGGARAEVATRLAVIYLMNRKPEQALKTLRATRTADLSNELREQRLLLEARALSDLGQRDLAIEVIADVKGRVAMRLRSDIYWAAHKWRQAAEQIELLYGDRWKQWQPLTDVERSDILRAELGYALADDKLDLDRFHDRYGAKMAGTPDARAFAIAAAPPGTDGEDFKEIAHAAAAEDTLDDFLRDMKVRYPESNPISTKPIAEKSAASPPPSPRGAKRSAGNNAPKGASPPRTRPAASAAPVAPAPPA